MASIHDLRCPHCPTTVFRRQEHLDRHLATHTDHRPYTCTLCDSSFKRSDALKRHLNTCSVRLARQPDLPASQPKAKRRRVVCDGCIKLRIKCSLGMPCDGCRARSRACVYSHEQSPTVGPLPQHQRSPRQDTSFPSLSSSAAAARLPFVSRIVSSAGLGRCFCPETFERASEPADGGTTGLEFQPSDFPDLDPDDFELRWLLPPAEDDDGHAPDSNISVGCLPQSPAQRWAVWQPSAHWEPLLDSIPVDPLASTTTAIVCLLREKFANQTPWSLIQMHWSPALEQTCASFFCPTNIRTYLHLFWQHWYPHCPIIHKPSFDIQKAPLPLLISMLLVGAQFAGEETVNARSRAWLNVVEELVFNDQCFKDGVTASEPCQENCQCGIPLLKHVQAALLVCVLQNWAGSPRSQMRVRRYRFGMIIAAARYMNPALATHRDIDLSEFSWSKFIKVEETIRTLHFILWLDVMFMISYNMPPQLTVRELKMDLICAEICFRADSPDLCLLCLRELMPPKELSRNHHHHHLLSVSRALELICHSETVDQNLQSLHQQVDKPNLVSIMYALHILIFYFKASVVFDTAIRSIRRGLERWKTLWDLPPGVGAYKPGPVQYAGEFWTLAHLLIAKLQGPAGPAGLEGSASEDRYDAPDMKELTRLLQEFDLSGQSS